MRLILSILLKLLITFTLHYTCFLFLELESSLCIILSPLCSLPSIIIHTLFVSCIFRYSLLLLNECKFSRSEIFGSFNTGSAAWHKDSFASNKRPAIIHSILPTNYQRIFPKTNIKRLKQNKDMIIATFGF